MNVWDVLILLAVIVCLLLAARGLKRRRGGCPGCCANCQKACESREETTPPEK